jgi:hypothetical protein
VSGKMISKILFSPVSAFAGEKKLHRAVQNGTVQFFFFKKRKTNLEVTQKWVMTDYMVGVNIVDCINVGLC